MIRTRFVAAVVAALLSLVLLGCRGASEADAPAAWFEANEEAPAARSLVLVTLDTTRADRLEPYGAEMVATPVMKRLADRGVVFERAWAVAPITLVAHTSILSGRYPFEHGVRNNGTQVVAAEIDTLAERLAGAAYRTAAFVSAAVLERRYGLDQGFEVYDDDLSARINRSPRMVADRSAETTVAAASAWLDGLTDDEPYFLWVHFYDPHATYSPPAPFRDTYRDRLYDGEIAYMDHQLGRLLAHRRIFGGRNADPPVVTVIGDHGESLGEHGERTHGILAYDAALHVPWILFVPGMRGGVRVPEPVGQVDAMPTLLALLGLDADTTLPGRDLMPLVHGRQREPNRPYYAEAYLPFYTYGWAKLRVLSRGLWKLIDGPTPELYNRRRDPAELTDVHAQEPGMAHDLKRDLEDWLGRYDAEREERLELDAETVAKLRSLGYVSAGSGTVPRGGERPNPMAMIAQHVSLERARSLLADRLFMPARRQLERVLRSDPTNLAALIDLVHALEGTDEVAEAIRVAERVQALDPDHVAIYLTLSRLEARAGNLDRSLDLADLAMAREGRNPEARLQKVVVLQRLGRPEASRTALVEALAAHPDHARTNAVYALRVELAEGRLEEAEARLRGVVEADPYLAEGWQFLAALLERGGRSDEAEAAYREGLKRHPDHAELHGALGHLLARAGQADEAAQQLREAIRLSSDFRSDLHVSLGALLAEAGRLEEAQREYDKVLAADAEHPGARNNAAIALYRMGQLAESKQALRELVDAHPDHADAHNNLAAIAVEEGRWSDAVRHSRRSLDLVSDAVESWNNLGIGLFELGDVQAAREAYEKALELSPTYWPAAFNLGRLLRAQRETAAAVEAFESVLGLAPDHGESHLELGELFADVLGDPSRARAHWNAFLRHAPGHPREPEIRRRLDAL